jgi:hypothetical protein
MEIYEVINHLGEVRSYWNTYEEALSDYDLEASDEIRCRELNAFEQYTDTNFFFAVESLEKAGLSRSTIAKALRISRWTLDNWMKTKPRLKPAQMISLLHLSQVFL